MSERSALKTLKKSFVFVVFSAVHIIGHLIILYFFKKVYTFLRKSYFFINILFQNSEKEKILPQNVVLQENFCISIQF